MARKKYNPTEGLNQTPDGRYYLQEIFSGKRKTFSSMEPEKVWEKRDTYAQKIAEDQEARRTWQTLGPLFTEVAEEYEVVVDQKKPGTQRAYKPAIKRAKQEFSGYRMGEIKPYMISEWLKRLHNEGVKARTSVSNHKTVMNSIFDLWIQSPKWQGEQNPSREAKMPRGLKRGKRQPPEQGQVDVVKNALGEKDAIIPIAYLCTGERRGESCAIQLHDIDFEKKTISITKSVEYINNHPHIRNHTKTEAGIRVIPLLSLLEQALEPIRDMASDTYILSGTKEPLTQSAYERRWAAFWRSHGMATPIIRSYKRTRNGKEYAYQQTDWKANVCAHQFRHEYVCMLAMAEVPEAIAIQLVGHANPRMIHEVYMALKPEMVSDVGAKLNQKFFSSSEDEKEL